MYLIVACTQININMRCIEIQSKTMTVMRILQININMRCIEIVVKVYVMYILQD